MSSNDTEPDFQLRVPEGDDRERAVCRQCGFVAYENPKIVAGSVVRVGEKILLCRRAIEPRRGFWTIPAGYLELNESPEEAAVREAREEACADIRLGGLLSVYTIHRLSQVQLIYRSVLSGGFAAGDESLEVALFSWSEIPWNDIAFPSVVWALTHDREVVEAGGIMPFANPDGATADLKSFVERNT
ncbi:NUDIX hydrolase [Amorphus orientalis]|uniref:ADP-ribose pyrophosphatase YjhB (NUDIX family) n=1 Tax=Amorphus orientalis TaxID=649198 RepID=A0AAE3VTC1_9HYPH|nr:NUDIX hydrolase [Amorphus orientalis]MDQ0317226.1 ADP-ribose pyrophosphatase YjhB (NUDIX family) [Amorphus orientalis]